MRTLFFSVVAAASALAFASPASAQYYPQPSYGGQYGAPYGGGYGYNQHGTQHWGQQLDRFRNDVRNLSARGLLTRREVQQSNHNIRVVERALRKYSRNGFNQREAWDMDRRLANLQVSIRRHASDADRRGRRYR